MNHRFVRSSGIKMHIAEDGKGPPVVLCHGFPELWYSWRHRLERWLRLDTTPSHRTSADTVRPIGQRRREKKAEAMARDNLELSPADCIDALLRRCDRRTAARAGTGPTHGGTTPRWKKVS